MIDDDYQTKIIIMIHMLVQQMFGISLELLFKKEYTINSEIEKVWRFLTNIEMITDCIPYLKIYI